jgi:hypothetical protein
MCVHSEAGYIIHERCFSSLRVKVLHEPIFVAVYIPFALCFVIGFVTQRYICILELEILLLG